MKTELSNYLNAETEKLKAEQKQHPMNTNDKAVYSIQNQSCLLNPNTMQPMAGDRIYIGDTVCGEWYDTGNEIMADKIVKTLNEYDALCRVAECADEFCKASEIALANGSSHDDKMLELTTRTNLHEALAQLHQSRNK